MAIRRVAKKGCWLRGEAKRFASRWIARRQRWNILVPDAIERLTGRPFVDTWMQMKAGPMRFSGYWRRK